MPATFRCSRAKRKLQKMAKLEPYRSRVHRPPCFRRGTHPHPRQRHQLLRDLRTSAKRHGLGKPCCTRCGAQCHPAQNDQAEHSANNTNHCTRDFQSDLQSTEALTRGNTGGVDGPTQKRERCLDLPATRLEDHYLAELIDTLSLAPIQPQNRI